ncbi:unnamed protein product [Rotaria sp. Silwood1]|nr:unnamed protein product [Rotaria sp. Silwood1]CAF1585306.1 unnamed protein product [Rotaria sp. Silwood1]CAF3707153.1 unnamed protein product [Rotaria sp. Silwood1]CAF3708449.1 unnamed protein product [Rotaria sp. Silwood1]CAF4741714.1 unnamed protein product [Rotaria sp. Silwood1]
MNKKYSRKIACLIDCIDGIDISTLFPGFCDNFPLNCDIFIFYHTNQSKLNRYLKQLTSNNHDIYLIPISEDSIAINFSFKLGQINDKYNDFILVSNYNPIYEDICKRLLETNIQLKNHIQFRCFNHLNEFIQFLNEFTNLQNENKEENQTKPIIINYSKEKLFHSCPFETKQQSSYLYRFGQLLHHLDTEHSNVHYEYCTECEVMIENSNSLDKNIFEKHLKNEHWKENKGFQLFIWPLQ